MTSRLIPSSKSLLSRPPSEGIDVHCLDQLEISAAQGLFRFSKSGFYRFRDHHRIASLPGLRVHLLDIVNAFETERGIPLPGRVCLDAREYVTHLLTSHEVETKLKVSRRTSSRFRTKHKVPTLSGGFVHAHDLIAAMEAERLGKARGSFAI